jgi:rhodanese-related sulfurtransferase
VNAPRRPFLVFAVALLALRGLWGVLAGEPAEETMETWKKTVRTRFPDVPQLATGELAAWLADTNRPRPLLLDVREAREFRVSHLHGARQVAPDADAEAAGRVIAGHTGPIVLYCSVGWRSSALALRLRQAGRTNVVNLEGSIFAWANEDRPIVADGTPASRVHPYNRAFGRLLRPERRAEP